MVKKKAEEAVNGSVSAFAALKPIQILPVEITPEYAVAETLRPAKKIRTRRTAEPVRPKPSGYWASSNPVNPIEQAVLPTPPEKPEQQNAIIEKNWPEDGKDIDDQGDDQFDSSDPDIFVSRGDTIEHLSTFDPTVTNVVEETNRTWTVCLTHTDTLTLVGQFDIWVRRGAIKVLGAIIHSSFKLHRIYSPSTHSLPSITASQDPFGQIDQSAEITISSSSTCIRMLRLASPKFGQIWNHKQALGEGSNSFLDLSQRSFAFLKSSADDKYERPLQPLVPPADWVLMINQLRARQPQQPVAVMVCGPKGSGKSSFCRILANSLLGVKSTPVQKLDTFRFRMGNEGLLFLDIDPGQPEFSPPGEISLIHMRSFNLGVPYTHPVVTSPEGNRVIRAHFIGAVSPKDNPDHYLQCALDLIHHAKLVLSKHPSCALIVNCSGWIQGSGLEVLTEIILRVAFTAVVYTSQRGPAEVVEILLDATSRARTQFHTLSSQPSSVSTRTPSDLRMMQTLSYFHLDAPEGGQPRWNPSPINEIPPLVIRYAGPAQDFFAIMILGAAQDPDNFSRILEGSVVGLVAIEDDSAISPIMEDLSANNNAPTNETEETMFESSDTEHPPLPSKTHPKTHPSILRTPSNLPYLPPTTGTVLPLPPKTTHSLGQALILRIDPHTQTMHLLTPIPPQTLQHHTPNIVLVRGTLDPPLWAYSEDLVLAAARRRRRLKVNGFADRFGGEEMRAWAEGVPWAGVVDGSGEKGFGRRVWRVRRGLKGRGEGGGGSGGAGGADGGNGGGDEE